MSLGPESSRAPTLGAGITSLLLHGLSVSEHGGKVGMLTESFWLGESWREIQRTSHLCVLLQPLQGQQFTAAVAQGELVTGREELWEKHLWSTASLFWLSQSSPSSTNTDMFVHSLLRFLRGAGIGRCIIVVPCESTSAQYFSCKQKLLAL